MDRRNLVLGAALAGAAAAASCAPSSTPAGPQGQQPQRGQAIKVGYIPFPPAIVRDPNSGRLSGHLVDTIEEIAKEAGWKLSFVETGWATFAAGLDAGRFAISIAPTFVTIPRATAAAFTRPLFFAGNSAVIRRERPAPQSIFDLDRPGVTIAVTQGEAGSEFAAQNFHAAQIRTLPGPDQTLTLQEVAAGRADAALGDAYVVSQFAAAHSGQVKDAFAQRPYNLTPVAWSVRTGDLALLTLLNAAIETLDVQGRLKAFERSSGAQWLHLKRDFELTG